MLLLNKEKNKNKKTTAFLSRGTLIELYNMCVDICHRIPNDLISSLNQTGFFDFGIHLVFGPGSRIQQIINIVFHIPIRVQEQIYMYLLLLNITF